MYDTPTTRDNLRKRAWEQIKTEEPLWGHYVSQKISAVLSMALFYTPITPHMITFLSFVFACGAAWSFQLGGHMDLIIGAVLLNISLIFDCSDGHIARLKGQSSHTGAWMDTHADRLKDIILIIGFAYGAVQIQPEWTVAILLSACVGISFQFMRNLTTATRDVFSLNLHGKKDKNRNPLNKKASQSQFHRSLKYSLQFKIADRVFFYTVFAVLNQAVWGLFLYAGLQVIYSSLAAAVNYKVMHDADTATTTDTQ
jgi:phosphatidylglycerophosphate synthase